MPCQALANCSEESCLSIETHKTTNYACTIDADESIRIRLDCVPHRYHENHIAAKEINSLNHYNLVHKFFPMPQAMKLPDAKAAVGKERRHGSWQKSTTRKTWSMKQRIKAERFMSRHWWIIVILRIRSWSFRYQKYKWHCERWFRITRIMHWTRIISITNDSRKSHGHYIKTTKMRRTSSKQSIRLYSVQNSRCTDVIDSRVRMSRCLNTITEKQMAQIIVQYWRPSCCSWRESARSTFDRTIWKWSIRTRLGIGNAHSLSEKKDFFICVCGRHQIDREKAEHQFDLETSHGRRWFVRTNIILRSCLFGLHSKRVYNKERHCDKLQGYMFESMISAGAK